MSEETDSDLHPTQQTRQRHVRREDPSGGYKVDRRAALAWVFALVAVALAGAVGFAHGKLWDHEGSLRTLDAQTKAFEKRVDNLDSKIDRILERVTRNP